MPNRAGLKEYLVPGGMSYLREIVTQRKSPLREQIFDEFATYAPFPYIGTRHMTEEELKEFDQNSV